MNSSNYIFDPIIQRATGLYSLPAVAMEVLELTQQENVDARALKDCIERDPALVAKILKVVNSSLFGLSSQVSDLNQALALLGSKTLKLLVLGFNLPEALFADIAMEPLERYWTMALTKGVAAREIAQMWFNTPGDNAFIAALLEDLGILVLLKEFQEPYAKLIHSVWQEEASGLCTAERVALGFDHRQLTAGLLRHWGLPTHLIDAISAHRSVPSLAKLDTPYGKLAQILHLADLTAELVGRHRLPILPDLMEATNAYVGINREQMEALFVSLETKVKSLAEVLSLRLPDDLGFSQIIHAAHERMATLSEELCVPLARLEHCEETLSEAVLEDIHDLSTLSEEFIHSGAVRPEGMGYDASQDGNRRFHAAANSAREVKPSKRDTPQERTVSPGWTVQQRHGTGTRKEILLEALDEAIAKARLGRRELTLVLIRPSSAAEWQGDLVQSELLAKALNQAKRWLKAEGQFVDTGSPMERAFVLFGKDRSKSVTCVQELFRELPNAVSNTEREELGISLCGGLASITLVSKNFEAIHLLEAAERCLFAATQSGAGIVKSIEIY